MTPEDLAKWAARISWAVTTVEDCYGVEPRDPSEGWALYDADEDDPPIAVFSFQEDALLVAQILNTFAAQRGQS